MELRSMLSRVALAGVCVVGALDVNAMQNKAKPSPERTSTNTVAAREKKIIIDTLSRCADHLGEKSDKEDHFGDYANSPPLCDFFMENYVKPLIYGHSETEAAKNYGNRISRLNSSPSRYKDTWYANSKELLNSDFLGEVVGYVSKIKRKLSSQEASFMKTVNGTLKNITSLIPTIEANVWCEDFIEKMVMPCLKKDGILKNEEYEPPIYKMILCVFEMCREIDKNKGLPLTAIASIKDLWWKNFCCESPYEMSIYTMFFKDNVSNAVRDYMREISRQPSLLSEY